VCHRALVASCLALLVLIDDLQKGWPLHTMHDIKVHDVPRLPRIVDYNFQDHMVNRRNNEIWVHTRYVDGSGSRRRRTGGGGGWLRFFRKMMTEHLGGGESELACLAQKERTHMSTPIFYVRTMMDRGTLSFIGWISDDRQ
jgi:hypothetical protein